MQQFSFPRRAGSSRLILLIAILMVVSIAAFWLWKQFPAQQTVEEGQEVAEEFLASLKDGKVDEVWESTTAEFKSAQGKESFVRKVKPIKFLKEPLDFVSVQTVLIGDQSRREFLYRAEKGGTVRIVVGHESGVWKVDRWTLE